MPSWSPSKRILREDQARKIFSPRTATAVLDFPNITAASQAELTVSVPGATVGQCVVLGPPAALEAGLAATGYVSAADTVKIRLSNYTAGAINPASATWAVAVLR